MKLISENQHYRTCIASSLSDVGQLQWENLLRSTGNKNPFLSFSFLHALHESGSACAQTGWQPHFVTIWDREILVGACPLYKKSHSYGEYVFDWSWAEAYQHHGLAYYPKLLAAIPFTPVTGSRLISAVPQVRQLLIDALREILTKEQLSSIHLLFPDASEISLLQEAGFLIRTGIQFHWHNHQYLNFDDFLNTLDHKKRKNIRAERRKITEQGISFRHIPGEHITREEWEFFKHCYDLTYLNHHSRPYLNLDFFLQIGASMQKQVHMILAVKDHQNIAATLLFHDGQHVYGRYWGCVQYYPCLHFETAYYQGIKFCIREKFLTFEGGAQGEHKMARGFLPQKTYSAHFLSHPEFNHDVAAFLLREKQDMQLYTDMLNDHNPYRKLLQNKIITSSSLDI